MGLVWNPWAVQYFVALGIAATVAVLVFTARPDRFQNRALAVLVLLEGLAYGWAGVVYVVDSPAQAYAAQIVVNAAFIPVLAAYLLFASTLASPLARPLRTRAARVTLAAAVATYLFFLFTRPSAFLGEVYTPFYARYEVAFGPWTEALLLAYPLIMLYAFGVSLTAFLGATRGSLERRRARMFAIAFGCRDALATYAAVVGASELSPETGRLVSASVIIAFPLSSILLSTLLAYGILRYQLFDIDLRIKWTINRGSVAAIFLAIFFIVSQLIQAVTTTTLGAIAGAVAAGLLLFFLAPLQRMAEHVSDRTMPHVHDTDEYRTVRKREVYRAAVESAMQDGVVTEKERDVLATLAQELGLGPAEMRGIEREAVKGAASP